MGKLLVFGALFAAYKFAGKSPVARTAIVALGVVAATPYVPYVNGKTPAATVAMLKGGA